MTIIGWINQLCIGAGCSDYQNYFVAKLACRYGQSMAGMSLQDT
ncbi:hypothetical protein [Colwellia sp. PAMC 20917]|nr:hypothetical protein [Colwellia sp. PAMC 20917]